MNGFEIKVVEFPTKQLMGIKVRTNMAKAKEDCQALWQNFCPQLPKIYGKESYGVSIMLNAQDFDYWAALRLTNRFQQALKPPAFRPAPTPAALCRIWKASVQDTCSCTRHGLAGSRNGN